MIAIEQILPFTIPILTAILSSIIKADAVRIGIANASELTFIL